MIYEILHIKLFSNTNHIKLVMNSGDPEENAVGAQLMFVIVIIFQPSQTSNELKSVSSTEFVIAVTCPASMHHYSSK